MRTLSGYVKAANGELIAFSFLYNGRGTSPARGVQSELGTLLAEYGAVQMLRFPTFTTAIYDQYGSTFNVPAWGGGTAIAKVRGATSEKMPSGRFCTGKSQPGSFADSTQLFRFGSWVSLISYIKIVFAPKAETRPVGRVPSDKGDRSFSGYT